MERTARTYKGRNCNRVACFFPPKKGTVLLYQINPHKRQESPSKKPRREGSECRRKKKIPELLYDDGGVGELPAGPVAAVDLLQLGGGAILAAASFHRRGRFQVIRLEPWRSREIEPHLHFFLFRF